MVPVADVGGRRDTLPVSNLSPYLAFRSNAREAMEFYQSVFGGELYVSTFGDIPHMTDDPAERDLVMHAQLTTSEGFAIMGSDTPARNEYREPAGVSLSVNGDDAEVLQRYWDALSAEGTVTMPYDTPPWGGRFGMVVDKYGFPWMVSLNAVR